ncbi:MAG: F0F1 ATP synthase subunit B [Bacteroidota bacterium]
MDLVTPGVGLIFWTTLIFIILLLLLRKFAWKPILKAVKNREENIEQAINAAETARNEISVLYTQNEAILVEAKQEREKLLKETKEIKEKIIIEAKEKAAEEHHKIVSSGKVSIQNEVAAAETHLKNVVAKLSIEIAEKLIRAELSDKEKQEKLVNDLLKDVKLN